MTSHFPNPHQSIKKVFWFTKPIIAMIHVFEGDLESQINQALLDLSLLEKWVDGVIVENYDCGYKDSNLATKEMGERLIAVTKAVVKHTSRPVGVNVLPNDYEQAFQICAETGARFVQLDHVTGQFVGKSSVDPEHLLSIRKQYEDVILLGGIHPKYYTLVDPSTPINQSAVIASQLTDAIVVTGEYTGGETQMDDLQKVKAAAPDCALIIGSGLNVRNIKNQLSVADGAIVGTAFKRDGVKPGSQIDEELVSSFRFEVLKHFGISGR